MKKKILALLIGAALLVCSLAACGGKPDVSSSESSAESTVSSEAEESSQAEDLGEISTLYNPNFKIEKLADGIKRVTDGDGRELILVPKSLGKIPDEYANSTVITTPVKNAVLLSSTQVCTFRTVNDAAILDSIGAVEGDADSWSDIPGIAERISSGKIIDIAGDGGMGEPDYEKIQALNPDVVFVYTGEYGQQATIAKLDELGINYAVDNEYTESSYLARMEWMRFLLTFFNADDAAEKAMSKVQNDIDAIKTAISGQEKPVIAVFSVYNGSNTATHANSWAGAMIADMGGINAFSGVDTNALTTEAAFDVVNTADVIIYTSTPSYCNGIMGITDAFPQITECKAYENNRIYMYSAVFWHSIDQTDIVAGDMAAILYPDLFADRTLSYYIKIEK